MNQVWLYSLASAFIVSLVALIGIFTLGVKLEKMKRILIYLVSFSAGALLGDAFIHLLPELAELGGGFNIRISIYILLGILVFFVLEKFVHWQHCHAPITKTHIHEFTYMVLIGDSIHNFIDGLIIAVSYIISIPIGIATSIAVFLHEIPQEIGEFGILLYGGFSKRKAILLNFLTALTVILGVAAGLVLASFFVNIQVFLVGLAIGGFIYIAGSDLIPELHKETDLKTSLIQTICFIVGILIMLALLLLEI